MTAVVLLKVCFKMHLIPTHRFVPSSDPPWPVQPATFFHSILKSCKQKEMSVLYSVIKKKILRIVETTKENLLPFLWPVPENRHGRHRPCGHEWWPTWLQTWLLRSSLQLELPHSEWPRWICSAGEHRASITELKLCRKLVAGLVCSPQSGRAFGRQEVCKCSSCSQSSCKTIVQQTLYLEFTHKA